jgi:tripartite-type tricarboxylate transporter receptor subunit TctC
MSTTRPLPGLAALALLVAGVASAQDYPNHSIRLLTSGTGGNPDMIARLVAQRLSVSLHQSIVVDNHPDNILGLIAAKSRPDGYALMISGGAFLIAPLLQKTNYDPVNDFTPISLLVSSPNVLAVTPAMPVSSVRELIALAKAEPGKLNYFSSSVGGAAHLSSELFKSMAGGLNIVRIGYNSVGEGLNDVISGRVQIMIASAGPLYQQIKAGKIKGLAVTSAEPTPLVPGLPTVAAAGVPGYESTTIAGMFAPKGTPPAIIDLVNRETVRVMNAPDMKDKFFAAGGDVVASTPDQFAATIQSELSKWGRVIKDAGIKLE